ncbi:hypertrehalosaemic prohormone [Cephus cinctus]|uniref:Hypertrehalosaemic prohormone n=1 Tax=Cephus cinctus TaxID=211228 RepID=A0AAJ7FLD1_CEPCN|nr:hypertrehalosaemic prohormone [Cephus cinctus]
MCPKIHTTIFIVLAMIFMILAWSAEAQLNFSTGWGKRSQLLPTGGSSSSCSSQGRPSLEQLLGLYNLIQMEAQRILDCQKLTK